METTESTIAMEVLYDFGKVIYGIAIDSEDNIFVANFENKSIDRVSLNNGVVSITQSTEVTHAPFGLAINSKNEIYFATNNAEIKKITKEGIISSIAGKSGKEGFVDGIGKSAKIGRVYGICFDENDIAYFCDFYDKNYSIRKLTLEGKVSTICGGKHGWKDGRCKEVKFNDPMGIVYNNRSKIFYITDANNRLIRTMTADGNVNTLCRCPNHPRAIAIDGEGRLYIVTEDSNEKGKIITVDAKGEIKQMNIRLKNGGGIALNSKGDLFFITGRKLCVIRNCTKYPPHPLLPVIINVDNTKDTNNNNSNSTISETLISIPETDETDEEEEGPPSKKFKLSQKEEIVTTKKINIIVEYNQELKLLEMESIPTDLETLEGKLKNLLGISTQKIRVKYFDKTSSEFIDLDKIEQIPTSECILRVFSSNLLLSNIHSIEFSKLDFGTEDKENWKKIGSGIYSDVYLATYIGIEVVVKKPKSRLVAAESKAFQTEAEALCGITHPNIIQFLGVFVEPVPCFILEYMKGESLSQIIKQKRAGDRIKIGLAIDIATGLNFLHNEVKIVHREIKPQNILVDNSLTIARITDVKVSKILDDTTDMSNTHVNALNVKYAAPEYLHATTTNSKFDIWSFAITLWEMFSESEPYSNLSTINVMRKIILTNERPTPMPDAPPQLIKLIETCWSKDPKERPDSMQILETLKQVQATILLKQPQNSYQETTPTYNIYVNKLKMDNPQIEKLL